ncbi:4'-phosphopantetheinyl transferase family protein [Nonomuraea sp. 10N515B]|uniref:4'-phosphopantetheinyl transferase family protein n=1 Tax=Nonomuraea sp. 10N515B TaxID=3457422 RepID=UPI003FCE1744
MAGVALPDDLEIWQVALDQEADLEALLATLDEHERGRAGRFADAAAFRRYVVAHAAVRRLLAVRMRIAPAEVWIAAGRHGKPYAPTHPDVQWNLSHSGELALVAVAHGRSVGVDVERVRPELDRAAFAARFFSSGDAAYVRGSPERFASLWARREACVKAAGGRLAQGLRLPVRRLAPFLVRDAEQALPGTWLVLDIPVPPGYRAAVAISARPHPG